MRERLYELGVTPADLRVMFVVLFLLALWINLLFIDLEASGWVLAAALAVPHVVNLHRSFRSPDR